VTSVIVRPWQAVLFPVSIVFLLVALQIPRDTWLTLPALSLGSGAAGLSLMALAALLGARWKWVESLSGGLDRVYQTHKWLGIWALIFASVHLLFKADAEAWSTAAILTLDPAFARLSRQASYVALVFVVMLALNRNIPYGVWRWWHKLSGLALLAVVVHGISIKSPIPLTSPAGIWLASLASLGLLAALYKLLLYPLLSGHAAYRVSAISKGPSAVHLELRPLKRGLGFQAGQFAFLSIHEEGLREAHPFTIASASEPDGHVHFVIRALGDYTERLVARTTVGMHASIHAPFGCFERLCGSQREIWIAGGVGISPFIAWLDDKTAKAFDRVTLFYFHSPGRDFPNLANLEALARERGAEFVPVAGGPSAPAFTDRITGIARSMDPALIDVSFCGPAGLLTQVTATLSARGIPQERIRHELFEFR
jgi:predicted ferric reductase